MSTESKYTFYEKVMVRSDDPKYNQINGKLAAILGKSQARSGSWGYAIYIYDAPNECWSISEDALESTGEFDVRETFYDGSSISVSLEGKIVEGDD